MLVAMGPERVQIQRPSEHLTFTMRHTRSCSATAQTPRPLLRYGRNTPARTKAVRSEDGPQVTLRVGSCRSCSACAAEAGGYMYARLNG